MNKKSISLLYHLSILSAIEEISTFHEPIKKKSKVKKNIVEIIPKGTSKFYYGENSVIARTQENADKKAIKRGYLIKK